MELNPYASFLNGQDPIPVLTTTAERLQILTAGLTGAQVNTPPAPRKWSICNIVSHLADSEIVFSFRLRQTLAPALDQPHAIIQPFDQERWAGMYGGLGARSALNAFSALREWNLALIGSTPAEAMSKPVTHPERGEMTFRVIIDTMAGHDLNHLSQLDRIVAGFAPA